MEMVLKEGGIRDDGLNVDPVSGNEIPSGSLAEEVRDDIPAQLSGGEYVVPADVVRFFGVKYFEDLRMEAKSGLQDMERNGRIGGEPVEPQQQMAQNSNQGITEADLQALEAMMTTGVYEGGLMDKIAYTIENDPLVNERVNKKGMSVKFAQGGQVSSAFSDTNQIDKIIDQVSTMAQKNPSVMQELQQRGISANQAIKKMAPGGDVGTNSIYQNYLTPGYSTVIGGGTPQVSQPVTDDVTAGPVAPVSPVGPQPTPDVGQCGENGRWDGFKCIPTRKTNDNSDNGGGTGGGGTASSAGNWFEQSDITDINNFVDNQLKDVVTGGTLGGGDASTNPVSNLIDSGLGGILSNLPMVRVATSIGKLTNISKARAAVELNQKAGLINEKEAAALDAKINAAAEAAGLLEESNALASGSGRRQGVETRADKFGNKDGKTTDIELIKYLESLNIKDKPVVVPEGSSDTAPTNGGGTITETVIDNNGDGGGGNDRTTDAEIRSMQDARAKDRAEADAKERQDKSRGGGGYTGSSLEAREASQKTKSELEEAYGIGLNKGGLMKKRKKK